MADTPFDKPDESNVLWAVVRLAAEGSDWKRDQGETLAQWAERTLATRSAVVASLEPVAWRYRYGKNGSWRLADTNEDCNPGKTYEIEPLYSAQTVAALAPIVVQSARTTIMPPAWQQCGECGGYGDVAEGRKRCSKCGGTGLNENASNEWDIVLNKCRAYVEGYDPDDITEQETALALQNKAELLHRIDALLIRVPDSRATRKD